MLVFSLVAMLVSAPAGDSDPVKDKLFVAKMAYDAEMREYRKLAGEWFDKREDAVRNEGIKKRVDEIKEERKWFDASGELPKAAPTALHTKPMLARKQLEDAYTQAVKDYVKAKKDDEAAAVEAAWKEFLKKQGIELLPFVDPKKHSVNGEWSKDEKSLRVSCGPGGKVARLQLPYEPSEEYDMEVLCRRISGDEAFGLGLIVGGRQVVAVIDGWPDQPGGPGSAIDRVDKKHGLDNVTTIKGRRLDKGVDHTIVCSVRVGIIDVTVDGKKATSFKGSATRLSLSDGWDMPNKKALFLLAAANTTFQIPSVTVSPIKGKGTIVR